MERRRRHKEIIMKRKQKAKRKKAEGFLRVVERKNGRKKIRFIKPKSAE